MATGNDYSDCGLLMMPELKWLEAGGVTREKIYKVVICVVKLKLTP